MATNGGDDRIDDRTTLVVTSTARRSGAGEEHVHYLVVTEGAEHGRIIELGSEPLTIGRTPPCEIVLRDVELNQAVQAIVRRGPLEDDHSMLVATFE